MARRRPAGRPGRRRQRPRRRRGRARRRVAPAARQRSAPESKQSRTRCAQIAALSRSVGRASFGLGVCASSFWVGVSLTTRVRRGRGATCTRRHFGHFRVGHVDASFDSRPPRPIGTAERSKVRREARGVRRHSRFLECRSGASKSVTESSPGEVVYDPTSPRGVAIGPIGGAVDPLQRLLGKELLGRQIEAIAVVGDLGAALSKADAYRAVFHTLGETGLPAFWIPGQIDAPISEYLRESHTMEVAFARLRGTAAVPTGRCSRSRRGRGRGASLLEPRRLSGPLLRDLSRHRHPLRLEVEVHESAGVTAEQTA